MSGMNERQMRAAWLEWARRTFPDDPRARAAAADAAIAAQLMGASGQEATSQALAAASSLNRQAKPRSVIPSGGASQQEWYKSGKVWLTVLLLILCLVFPPLIIPVVIWLLWLYLKKSK